MAVSTDKKPIGYRWRSSKWFIVSSITIALFCETFLYGFVVPILSYMLEVRLQLDPSKTQRITNFLLAVHGFTSVIAGPIIGHFADKTPNRKAPLLIALAGCLVGTVLVACTPSLWALCLGRILQALAGSGAWIVGLATLADNAGLENLGKMMALAMSFITTGIIAGPMAGGALLELIGYWPAWSVPMAILVIDIIMRLVMIETRPQESERPGSASTTSDDTIPAEETTALLSDNANSYQTSKPSFGQATPDQRVQRGFWLIMLTDARVLAGLSNSLLFSSLLSAFDATLPLHLRDAFHWGSLSSGMMFFCLQLPSILLGPLVGWLRDRAGLKYPAAIGWALLAPVMWLMGVPGDSHFPWADPATSGKPIFIASMIGFGVISNLVRGVGSMQMAAVCCTLQKENPGIFGEHGGNSRVFSICEIAFSVGMVIGPAVAGSLSDIAGYYWMNVGLAIVCAIVAVICLVYLSPQPVHQPSESSDHSTDA